MLKSGDVLDLGPLGTKFIIKRTPSESGGQTFDMEWELAPRTGGTPLHVHPHATETYEILEGSLDVNVNGTWKTLRKGDRQTVEPGVPHTFRNASDAITRVYNTHQPAMKLDQYLVELDRIANSGVIHPNRMTLPAILSLAVLISSHEDEIRSVQPPHFLMRAFALVGRTLGYGPG
jgi:mannose-6-phosphate isomerase-like protein (cupin superfamily)